MFICRAHIPEEGSSEERARNPKEAFEGGIISSREGHSDGNVYERRRRTSARGGGCDQ
jgi:hypothetical protein